MTARALLFMNSLTGLAGRLAEDIVSHVNALLDALHGVEVPMYAQVNPALRVFPFRVAKRWERGWRVGHDVAVNI